MTREEQIKAIYEKIADKTLSFGCKIIMRDREYIFISEWNKKIENIKWNLYLNTEAKYILDFICSDKIIWHLVMINRIEFILQENDYLKIRKTISKEELLLPIDEWNEKSIDLLYKIVLTLNNKTI